MQEKQSQRHQVNVERNLSKTISKARSSDHFPALLKSREPPKFSNALNTPKAEPQTFRNAFYENRCIASCRLATFSEIETGYRYVYAKPKMEIPRTLAVVGMNQCYGTGEEGALHQIP
jgi:hypothetical protein